MKLFIVTLLFASLLFSCSSSKNETEKIKEDIEEKQKQLANERLGDSIVYEIVPLYNVAVKNEKFMKIYDILMSLNEVNEVFEKYGKKSDIIFLGIINGETLNDTLVKLPNDTLKMVLYVDSARNTIYGLSISYALTGEPEIRIKK